MNAYISKLRKFQEFDFYLNENLTLVDPCYLVKSTVLTAEF